MLTLRQFLGQCRASNAAEEGSMNLTGLIAVVAVVALLFLAVGVGMELDTEAQRRERQRLAEERRARNEERRAARTSLGPLCERCPYRERL